MRLLFIFGAILLLSSCLYTKQAAIRKFCLADTIRIDSNWKINGVVVDSAHTGSFFIKDSCDVLRMLYDSLVEQGRYIIDTSDFASEPTFVGAKDSSVSTPIKQLPHKWAVVYKDSIVLVKFRFTASGKFQFDVQKLQREIPYQAQANFKAAIKQPCPPPPPLPWWHKWVSGLFWFLLVYFIFFNIISYRRRK